MHALELLLIKYIIIFLGKFIWYSTSLVTPKRNLRTGTGTIPELHNFHTKLFIHYLNSSSCTMLITMGGKHVNIES